MVDTLPRVLPWSWCVARYAKVEDWATELNSLFSDKPSMSLVEASGTRWLEIWLEIFGDVLSWLDFGDVFFTDSDPMGWTSPWFHHHFHQIVMSLNERPGWSLSLWKMTSKGSQQGECWAPTNCFWRGWKGVTQKNQHWRIKNMLWWFEFVEEKGEMMEHQWL